MSQNDDTGRRDPITYRDPGAIRAVLEFLIECENDDEGKAAFTEVIDTIAEEGHHRDTVEKMLYELQAFGAIRRTGRYQPRKDTRRLVITTLGRHWLEGTHPDPLGGHS